MTAKKAKTAAVHRRTTTTVVEGAGDEINILDNEPEQDQDELSALLELGGENEIKWQVSKLSQPNAGFCTDYSSGELSLSRIQDEWGGGQYRIKGTDTRGRFVGQRTIRIADKAKPQQQQAQQPQQDLQALLYKTMLDGAQRQADMLQNLLITMIQRPEKTTAAPDPIAMIAALKDIMQPAPAPKDNGIDTLLKGLELGKELAGGGDGGGGDWSSVIGKGLDTFKPLLVEGMKQQQAQQAPAMGTHQAPRTLPAPAASGATVNNQEGQNVNIVQMAKVLPWMQQQVRALVHQASRGKDPALYAEVFMDNLPEFVTVELIVERFNQESALDDLAAINSGVLNYREWFEAFRVEVLELISADPEDLPDFAGGISTDAPIGGDVLDHDGGGND